eukprot:CAMPEP_0201263380 /NCGR_PEP_ID=MMETSP0853-20130426/7197_1 /ASSEMBLY_ACC=CAM_ASM_000640 /TAXON_ID=183588 /ORGANISM="Pseudo-nitzschia fraudulenta, Strain WWA7" /LENGTH=184 /DNA_ID=CAMNT_0047566957 /DNA_START=579 /DNA_END=1131 /DNA_ORIENTATION=-
MLEATSQQHNYRQKPSKAHDCSVACYATPRYTTAPPPPPTSVGPVVVPRFVATDPLAGQVQCREGHHNVLADAPQQRGDLGRVATGRRTDLRRQARADLGGELLQEVPTAGLGRVVLREVVSPEHPLDLLLGVEGGVVRAGLEAVSVDPGKDQEIQEAVGEDAREDLRSAPDAKAVDSVFQVGL